MPWRTLTDPENAENKNAGNGGDLVKHTVYLTVLDYLLQQQPWAMEIRVRECHAGRGMYRTPEDVTHRPLLECLYHPLNSAINVPLHDIQRDSQTALQVWPRSVINLEWYSGSAVLNAWHLGHAARGNHLLEFYECAPDTRAILRAVFADPRLQLPRVALRILPEPEDGQPFDGERHIEESVTEWTSQDLILLDPFAMWRMAAHQARRGRYRRILDHLVASQDSFLMILFWTWGRAFPSADGDIDGTNEPVANGYQQLRQLLHDANRHFVRVRWRWGLQFAIWVVAPSDHLYPLQVVLQDRCDELRDHLRMQGCGQRLRNPDVEADVD